MDYTLETLQRIVVFYVLPVVVPFIIAYSIQVLSEPIARRLVPFVRLTGRKRTVEQRDSRRQTLVRLIAASISSVAFFIALMIAVGAFVGAESLVWLVGLFAAGFGFSAKPFIGDYMTGIMFIIEDDFDMGEKVEIVGVEGVVEDISLRTTTIRGMDGEEYTIPNGEIRTVRNFSRGRFTPVKITVRVPSNQLRRTVRLLESAGEGAMIELPDLLEPWRVIAEEGTVGENMELTLVAKAEFGKGASMRPRMLSLVQEILDKEGILLHS